MDTAIGRLTTSWVTDYLPFLAAHIVAGNFVTQPRAGFVLYNVTDAIMATDVSSWLTRWLVAQPITYTSSLIRLKVEKRRVPGHLRVMGLMLGLAGLAIPLLLTAAQRDWWGVANSVAMTATVCVRQGMVTMLCQSMDDSLEDQSYKVDDNVKVFLTLPQGTAVTVLGPRSIIVNCLLTDPKPSSPSLYLLLRIIGWIAFGIHVIALVMATLPSQILAVALLLTATVLKACRVGDRLYTIGSRLTLDFEAGDSSWTRRSAYARLSLTGEEEATMRHWSLMPLESNRVWWQRYRELEKTQGPQIKLAFGSAASHVLLTNVWKLDTVQIHKPKTLLPMRKVLNMDFVTQRTAVAPQTFHSTPLAERFLPLRTLSKGP